MYKKISQMKTKHQILFSVLIGFAVVAFWRGVWGIMDEYLFPNNYKLSSIISLILGITVLAMTNYITKELL